MNYGLEDKCFWWLKIYGIICNVSRETLLLFCENDMVVWVVEIEGNVNGKGSYAMFHVKHYYFSWEWYGGMSGRNRREC